MLPPVNPGKAKGFTLIELLAAVAIVVFLASLLYAGFGPVMENSRKAKCAGQLRAISHAVSLYAGENNMNFPPSYGGVADPKQTWWWYNFDSPLAAYAGNAQTWMKITICDKNRSAAKVAASGVQGYPYAVNYNVMPTFNSQINFTVVKATQVSNPSRMILMMDSVKGDDWGWGFRDVAPEFKNWNRASENHLGTANVLWCDGHVTATRKSEIRSENCLIQ